MALNVATMQYPNKQVKLYLDYASDTSYVKSNLNSDHAFLAIDSCLFVVLCTIYCPGVNLMTVWCDMRQVIRFHHPCSCVFIHQVTLTNARKQKGKNDSHGQSCTNPDVCCSISRVLLFHKQTKTDTDQCMQNNDNTRRALWV